MRVKYCPRCGALALQEEEHFSLYGGRIIFSDCFVCGYTGPTRKPTRQELLEVTPKRPGHHGESLEEHDARAMD
jgi:hypothetical protein